jgi:hypothetical protein
MARPKGSKNKSEEKKPVEVSREELFDELEKDLEEKKPAPESDESISIYEASQQLNTTEPTIKVWIDHGHLTEINGRIPVRSIKMCKFNTRRMI